MIRIHSPFIAPLASIMTLVLGAGFYTTLTTSDMARAGVDSWIIGCVSSAYYCGLLIGGFKAQYFIPRVGHIRAFATFAACITVVSILQGLYFSPTLWVLLRFISGFGLAGVAVVVESWLMDGADQKDRGTILSIYMFAYYLALALGQVFLTLNISTDLEKYCLIAIFASLSTIPVCMTRFSAPFPEEPHILPIQYLYKNVPLGVWGCFLAGMVLGPLISLTPEYLKLNGKIESDIALIMMAIILGGTLLQYPIGKTSDKFDRRKVLLGVSIACIVLFLLFIPDIYDNAWLVFLGFLMGGAAFTIYPLCISHTIDHLKPGDTISAISTLLLAYGGGSAVGPLIAPLFTKILGQNGLCYYLFAIAIVLCGYTSRRVILNVPYKYDEPVDYVNIPTTSPNAVPERNSDPEPVETAENTQSN